MGSPSSPPGALQLFLRLEFAGIGPQEVPPHSLHELCFFTSPYPRHPYTYCSPQGSAFRQLMLQNVLHEVLLHAGSVLLFEGRAYMIHPEIEL